MASAYIDGDDEVVAEYDVFLSTGLAGDIHVFQFPLRPFSRPYEATSIELSVTDGVAEVAKNATSGGGVGGLGGGGGGLGSNGLGLGGMSNGGNTMGGPTSVNPSPTSRFHMRCTLDTYGSECFLPQSVRNEETQYQYEYALASAPFSTRSSYAIGLLRDDALHLCPVQSIQQFTPKVRSAVQNRSQVPPSDSPYEVVGPSHSSSTDTGPTSGSLRSRDRDLVRSTRSFMLNNDAKTSQPLVFYPMGSSESNAKKGSLVCSTITQSQPKAGAKLPTNTTDAFFPQDSLLDVSAEVAKKLVLRPGPYRRQEYVGDLVHSAQVLTATEAAEAMALCGHPNLTEADLVPLLREHAHYVHGVWVSRVPGVKISFPHLREVILAQFVASPTGTVRRADINRLITRNDPALLNNVLSILQSLAVLSSHENPDERFWTLRKMASASEIQRFASNYPQDYTFQREYWERRKPVIDELLNSINLGRDVRGGSAVIATAPRPPHAAAPHHGSSSQQSNVSGAGGSGATTASGTATSSATSQLSPTEIWIQQIRAFVRSLFTEHGVVNKQLAKQLIQTRSRDPRSPFYGASVDAMGNACRQELEGFTDSTFILQSANIPDVDMFRKFIIAAAKEKQHFSSADVVTRAERLIEHDYSSRGATVPPEMASIPKTISHKIISEISNFQVGEKLWHLKTGFIDVQQ